VERLLEETDVVDEADEVENKGVRRQRTDCTNDTPLHDFHISSQLLDFIEL
jgi:hypothetical protein